MKMNMGRVLGSVERDLAILFTTIFIRKCFLGSACQNVVHEMTREKKEERNEERRGSAKGGCDEETLDVECIIFWIRLIFICSSLVSSFPVGKDFGTWGGDFVLRDLTPFQTNENLRTVWPDVGTKNSGPNWPKTNYNSVYLRSVVFHNGPKY